MPNTENRVKDLTEVRTFDGFDELILKQQREEIRKGKQESNERLKIKVVDSDGEEFVSDGDFEEVSKGEQGCSSGERKDKKIPIRLFIVMMKRQKTTWR